LFPSIWLVRRRLGLASCSDNKRRERGWGRKGEGGEGGGMSEIEEGEGEGWEGGGRAGGGERGNERGE